MRRLAFMNLLLVAMLGAGLWQIRERWRAGLEKERAMLRRPAAAQAAPGAPKVEPVAPLSAANYADVAARMLFTRDRNPDVVIEEKPPDPVPAFPIAYGAMDLGSGATVFMSETASKPQKGFRVGETIGPFRLASATTETLVLEWKDKKFEKRIEELKPKPAAGSEAATSQAPQAEQPKPVQYLETPKEEVRKAQVEASKGNTRWVDTGGVNHACAPGDDAPPGTVVGGYRKVVRPSMFGQTCYWEPAR